MLSQTLFCSFSTTVITFPCYYRCYRNVCNYTGNFTASVYSVHCVLHNDEQSIFSLSACLGQISVDIVKKKVTVSNKLPPFHLHMWQLTNLWQPFSRLEINSDQSGFLPPDRWIDNTDGSKGQTAALLYRSGTEIVLLNIFIVGSFLCTYTLSFSADCLFFIIYYYVIKVILSHSY